MDASKLRFIHEDTWVDLPAWGVFFFETGLWIGMQNSERCCLTVGLSVPTSAYSAALVATGVVISRSAFPVKAISAQEHFQQLLALPAGHPVMFSSGNRKYKGMLVGCEDVEGEHHIAVQVQRDWSEGQCAGGLTYRISAQDSLRVEVLSGEPGLLPKNPSGRRILPQAGFLKQCLGKVDPHLFASSSRLECVVLGKMNALRHEIKETRASVRSSPNGFQEGRLQDVVRVRKFMADGQGYRTDIFRIDGRKPPQMPGSVEPHAVIFDGTTAFLKWGNSWKGCHRVVIIDRTEPTARDAAGVLNREYISDRVDEQVPAGAPAVPAGVELASYWISSK